MSDAITPFKIAIDDAQLDDLKRRLAATRWPDKETPNDWSQGIPLAYVQDLCSYWEKDYDWRAREALLNRFPQFRTTIDGVGIHFIHVRSPHANALPLVMTHGWPGSIVEFQKVIEPLTDPTKHGGRAADAFHVVCPSLPGYGFSDKPTTTGWNVEKIGRAWSVLMPRLGYHEVRRARRRLGRDRHDRDRSERHGELPRHPSQHADRHAGSRDDERSHRSRKIRARRHAALRRLGLGLFEAAEHAAANARLRPRRFAERSSRVDPREVLGVDGLRWPSGKRR